MARLRVSPSVSLSGDSGWPWLSQRVRSSREAAERVDRHFRLYYGRGLDEYETASTPGYWRMRNDCERHPPSRPHRHTASYFDNGRDPETGRFTSPYQTWRELRQAADEMTAATAGED